MNKKRIIGIYMMLVILVSFSVIAEAKTDKTKVVFSDNFDDNDISDWSITTSGNADVIADNGAMRLRVYKCSNAFASKDLGQVNGNITVDFDYTTYTEGWGEGTIWKLFVGGSEVASNSFYPHPYGWFSDHFTKNLDVKGKTVLQYSLEQSPYCNNGDHFNTYYWIDNVTITKNKR